MRDPDLVQRAEQAAAALEKAWVNWQQQHGLRLGPLPPISSYVGYSHEEPWGQPRVVLGVAAEQAERLAAILQGHVCEEPVPAAVGNGTQVARQPDRMVQRADWRSNGGGRSGVPWQLPRLPSGLPGPGRPGPVFRIPAQPSASRSDLPRRYDSPDDEFAGQAPGDRTYDDQPMQPLPPLPPLPEVLSDAAAMADLPAELPSEQAALLQDLAAREVADPLSKPPAARRPAAAESATPAPPTQMPAGPASASRAPAARRPAVRRPKAAPVAEPVLPATQDDEQGLAESESEPGTAFPDMRDLQSAAQRTKARLKQVSKLSRPRKTATAAPEAEDYQPFGGDQAVGGDQPFGDDEQDAPDADL